MEEETHHKSIINTQQLTSSLLRSLKGAARDLRINNPIFSLSGVSDIHPAAISTIFELQAESALLSSDPNLFKLSLLLADLKTLHWSLEKSRGYSLRSILRRRITAYKIYQLAFKIEAEIQTYFDRQQIQKLAKTLQGTADGVGEEEEEEKIKVLDEFEERLSMGFDREFQELVLKAKLFPILESLLCGSDRPPPTTMRVREHAARVIVGLVRFNKDVFVGLVLMGSTVPSLVSMATRCSIQVLTELVSLIRTPLIDELELDGQIPRIVALLGANSADDGDLLPVRTAAFYCVCEIAYHGRKEVIEAMLEQGLVKKLVELQRSRHGDNFVEDSGVGDRPFGSCVARFAVQVEVGEGLSRREKKELKREMVGRVRDASVSEAEAASILAEVLWGSTP